MFAFSLLTRKLQYLSKVTIIFRFLILLVATVLIVRWVIIPVLAQQPVTLRILMRADEAAQWQPLTQKFNQQHPDIRLQVLEAPSDSDQVEGLYTASFLLGNSPYDLVYMDIVWTPKFAAAGWLEDLSNHLSEAERAKYLTGDIQGGIYQEKLYRVPFRSDAGMLYYRQDLLETAGVSTSRNF